MPDTPIELATFVCLDTETTGLSPLSGGKLCEVAALSSAGAARKDAFCTLVNPLISISAEATKIHGITNAMVAASPRFADIAPKLIDTIQGNVLVCHNADFDVSFLEAEFASVGLKMPDCIVLDTLKFARCHGRFSRNRLGVIAQELGISCQGWHRAMADTIMTEKIFYHFLNQFKRRGARTVGDLCALQTKKELPV